MISFKANDLMANPTASIYSLKSWIFSNVNCMQEKQVVETPTQGPCFDEASSV